MGVPSVLLCLDVWSITCDFRKLKDASHSCTAALLVSSRLILVQLLLCVTRTYRWTRADVSQILWSKTTSTRLSSKPPCDNEVKIPIIGLGHFPVSPAET